jgi:carotenoid cleavage dioxygenase-like enzyme
MTDNPKIHVAKIGERYMALGETPMQVEFDPTTLEKIGVDEIAPGAFAYKTTAHPHFENDHAFNLVVKFGMQSYYRIHDMVHKGKHLASIPVAKPAYMHGFGMSKRYFIIAAGPLVVVPIHLLFWKKPYIENHKWLPEEGGKIWVVEKTSGKVKAVFETDPFFTFHHINAWEEGDELIMDLDAYDDASIVSKYYLHELENPDLTLPAGKLKRYRMNMRTKRISEVATISDACIELPRIDYERFNMNGNYQHTYGVGLHPSKQTGFYNSIVKINTQNGDTGYWHEEGCYPGEPCFISSPDSKNDQEGILLSIVLDAAKENSFLLVLDATNLHEIARAVVPEPIVYGFHGEFFKN